MDKKQRTEALDKLLAAPAKTKRGIVRRVRVVLRKRRRRHGR